MTGLPFYSGYCVESIFARHSVIYHGKLSYFSLLKLSVHKKTRVKIGAPLAFIASKLAYITSGDDEKEMISQANTRCGLHSYIDLRIVYNNI